MYAPAVGFEYFSEGVTGENFCVLRAITQIGFIRETHDSIRPANSAFILDAIEA